MKIITYILGKISKISKRYRYYIYHQIRTLMLELTEHEIQQLRYPEHLSTYVSDTYIDDWQNLIKQHKMYAVMA